MSTAPDERSPLSGDDAEQHRWDDFMRGAPVVPAGAEESPGPLSVRPEVPGLPRPPRPPKARGPVRHVGWQVVPDTPLGTLAWWNGTAFGAHACWTVDRWVYLTGDWAGPDPPPGVLPDGAVEVGDAGWWEAPGGRWHSGKDLPLPSAPRQDRSLGFGVAGVVVESLVWLSWLLAFIDPKSFAVQALYIVPLFSAIGLVFGLVARRHSERSLRRVVGRRAGTVAVAMGVASIVAIAAMMIWFVIGAMSSDTMM